MWPPISSARMSLAYSAAWSALSANFTPPAFMRPPVSTCDLITVGPSIRSAISRASSAVCAKPESVIGTPSRARICRDSYSKKRMAAREPSVWPRASGRGCSRRQHPGAGHLRALAVEPVELGELGVLVGQHLGQRDHHLALLPGGVVLHLAVDHVAAPSVGDRLKHLLRELDLVRRRAENLLRDLDLDRVQRPGPDAAEQERRPELGLAAPGVLDVAVGPVEGKNPGRRAGVHHAGDRVVPG